MHITTSTFVKKHRKTTTISYPSLHGSIHFSTPRIHQLPNLSSSTLNTSNQHKLKAHTSHVQNQVTSCTRSQQQDGARKHEKPAEQKTDNRRYESLSSSPYSSSSSSWSAKALKRREKSPHARQGTKVHIIQPL